MVGPRDLNMGGYMLAINGEPVHPQKISKRFATLHDESLKTHPSIRRLTFYDTRHCGITMWLRAGVDLRLVSRMAGHSSMYFTADTYAEVLKSDITDAAQKMGQLFGG